MTNQKTEKKYHDPRAMYDGQPVGVIKRFIAYLIDFYLGMLLCSLPIVLANGILNQSEKMQMNLFFFEGSTFYVVGCLSLVVGFLYYVYVPLKVWKGQTPAKHFLHIKIVKVDGDEVDGKAMVLRQIVGMFLLEGAVVSCSSIIRQMLTYATAINFVDLFIYIGFAITIASSILMLLNRNRRMLHDFIATTKVIQIA